MKTLVALVAGTVVSLCLWVLTFHYLLRGFFSDYSMHYAGLLKSPPVYWSMIASSFFWAAIIIYVLSKSAGNKNIMSGMTTGAIVAFLISASNSALYYAAWNVFARRALVVDVIVITISGAITGAVMGWIMGMGKKE